MKIICKQKVRKKRLLVGVYLQQEDSGFFYGTLYGFYDVTRCYLCNNTYISINIWNLADAYLQQEASNWIYLQQEDSGYFMALCMVFMLQDVICVIILI